MSYKEWELGVTYMGMMTVFAIGAVIIVLVIGITALVTTKAYEYKHTIDPLDNNPHLAVTEDNHLSQRSE